MKEEVALGKMEEKITIQGKQVQLTVLLRNYIQFNSLTENINSMNRVVVQLDGCHLRSISS